MNNSNAQMYNLVLSNLEIEDDYEVLEIGPGNGLFVPRFFEVNPSIHLSLVDFSDVMCSEATTRNGALVAGGRLDIRCENSLSTSFDDNTFDVVVSVNTVYFWEDFEEQLNEIKRIMLPGGQLVIGYRPRSVMENLAFAKEQFILFDPADMRLLMEDNGFRVVKEKQQATSRKSVNGSIIKSTDICLVLEKK